MDPITIAMLGMSGLNMLQNQSNAKDAKVEREAAIRYSPWNNIGIPKAERANPMGDLAQGGGAALAYEQNKERNQREKDYNDAAIRAMDSGRMSGLIQSPMMNSQNVRGYGPSPWMGALNSPLGQSYGY